MYISALVCCGSVMRDPAVAVLLRHCISVARLTTFVESAARFTAHSPAY